MTYKYLGARGPFTGTPDQTGLNPGNWTIVFAPAMLNFTVPEALVYKATVSGALGSSFNVYIEAKQFDSNIFGNQNSWEDQNDTLIIRPTETMYFMYSNPDTDGQPPVATIFLRYDMDKFGLYGNQA